MLVRAFREYLALAKYMSVTKAAEKLHMSQSNLSRHIKNMETDLGFPLIKRHDNKISLTSCGVKYANGVRELVDQYDSLLKDCEELYLKSKRKMTVMDLPYGDEAAACYLAILKEARRQDPLCSFSFSVPYRSNVPELLREGKFDIALAYRYGDPEEHLLNFENDGLCAYKLTKVEYSVWCKQSSSIAQLENVSFEDLANTPVIAPNDLCSPSYEVLTSMFERHGSKPAFRTVNTASQTEFLMCDCARAVFVLPTSMQNDPRLRMRVDLARIPLAEDISDFYCYAIAAKGSEGDSILNRAIDRSSI